MSQKITISELRAFIKKEAIKLCNIHILKERKAVIEKKLKIISENTEVSNLDNYQEIYDEIEMMMRPEDHTLTFSELNDIANTYGIDFEDALHIQSTYLNDRAKEEEKDLHNDAEDALIALHDDGITSPSFLEFAHKFNSIEHIYTHSIKDIRGIFDKLTKDPKQLAMFEQKLNELDFDQNGNPYGFPNEHEDEVELYHSPAQIKPENIYFNKYHILTVKEPIITDAVKVLSKNKSAVEFHNKNEFLNFADEQSYFSASDSHCFYSLEEKNKWSESGHKIIDPDSKESIMVFETGHELIQIWDNKNKIGFVLPKEQKLKENGEKLDPGTDCIENPKVCMTEPSTIMDPRPEMEEAFGKTPQSFLNSDGDLTNIATDTKLHQGVDTWLERVQLNSDKKFETQFPNTWARGEAPKFVKKIGEKFIKILSMAPGSNAVFAFIDLNGNIYKAASSKAPAKGVRGNIYDENAPITSGALYR